MISRIFQQTNRWAMLLLLAMSTTVGYAQFQASCQNHTTTVSNLFGTPLAVVDVSSVNNGSFGGDIYFISPQMDTTLYLSCNGLNFSPSGIATLHYTMAVVDSNMNVMDTCGGTITIIDSLGLCGGSGFSTQDSTIIDASACNFCDGYGSLLMIDNNTGLVASGNAPYTFLWSDGMVTTSNFDAMGERGNLCPGTYSVTIIDNAGNMAMGAFTIGCSGSSNANALCAQSITLDLFPNGVATVTQGMIDSGSVGVFAYVGSNGNWGNTISFDCDDLGVHTVVLAVTDGAVVDSCATTVIITDSLNVCGGQSGNGTTLIDSIFDANNCNSCTGSAYISGLVDASGNSVPIATAVWFDGQIDIPATGIFHANLCPFVAYSVTLYDANQNAYPQTVMVGCSGGTTGCIDTSLIDTAAVCSSIIDFVCGCDGNTYQNSCIAQANGVTSWVPGACYGGAGALVVRDSTTGTSCDTLVCDGYSTLIVSLANGGVPGPCTYNWSDGFSSSNPSRSGLCAGVYTVDVVEANTGNWEIVTVIVGVEQGCVWPGDTDDNTVVNNYDLLPIALAYGESGNVRSGASLGWYGQSALDWNTVNPIAGLPNYKHIDANGDGLIDLNDLDGLTNNYGQSYYRSSSLLPGNIPLFVSSTTTQEGQRIGLPIHFGTPAIIGQDVYGLAFTIHYDPEKVDANSIDIDFANSWLGNDLLTFVKDFHSIGLIEVAIARKDRQNISNFGEIGTLNLTISDDILRTNPTETMDITISTVRVIDNINHQQGADTQTGVVTIELATGTESIEDQDLQVTVFPNPARQNIYVSVENIWIEELELRTATGQLYYHQTGLHANTSTIPVAELPTGIYLLSITTDKGIRHERVSILR